MINEIMEEMNEKMEKAVANLVKDYARVRTGRASVSLLDGIKVTSYGALMPVNQVASLATPENRLITIKPWDTNIIGEIEKAILKSDLGLTPQNDGKIIRISIPPLTEERRKEIGKLVKKMAEDYKVSIRNIRRDSLEILKSFKKDKEISEDDFFKSQDDVQKVTDTFIKKVEAEAIVKEEEIMTI